MKIGLIDRARMALVPGTIIKAIFDATRWSPNRAQLPIVVQDVVVDYSDSALRILIGKSRHLYQNSPIIHGMVERLVTYIVGTGLSPSPNSTDAGFNDTAAKSWDAWCKYADRSSRASFQTLQRTIVRAVIVDGEIFALLTASENNRPRVQLIEAHRIVEIETDEFGRPTFYVMKGKDDQAEKVRIEAKHVVHFFRPERAGQKRGVPLLASAINTAQDVDEILGLEKAAVKEHSHRQNVVTTKTGEAPVGTIGRSLRTESATTGKPDSFYREIVGGETTVLRDGETLTQLVSQRPSAAWQGFIDFLSNTLCFAANLPPSVFLQIKVGGADTRRDLAAAQRAIEQWQQDLTTGLQLIYEYVIEGDVRDLPADWRECAWEYPRAITVDAGRMAQQDRADVMAGTMTMSEYCGQYGVSFRSHLKQLDDELAEINPALTPEQRRVIIMRRLFGDQSGPAPVAA